MSKDKVYDKILCGVLYYVMLPILVLGFFALIIGAVVAIANAQTPDIAKVQQLAKSIEVYREAGCTFNGVHRWHPWYETDGLPVRLERWFEIGWSKRGGDMGVPDTLYTVQVEKASPYYRWCDGDPFAVMVAPNGLAFTVHWGEGQ